MSYCATTVGAVLKGIVSGKSIRTLERPAQGNEFGILKVSAVTWGEFRPAESKAMPFEYDPGDCPRAMDGDILISRANTRELVGAPVMVHGDHPRLLLSDKLLKLIPDETVVDSRYLVRALRSAGATLHFSQCAGGSSGSMTNITQGDIRSAPLPLPPLPEQRRIAAILDQADALRAKRREALAQLDSLTQSIFIEMFGDPSRNPKSWPEIVLSKLVRENDTINYGVVQPGDALDEGIPLIRVGDLVAGEFSSTTLKRIDPIIESAYKRSRLRGDEILVSCVGSIGVTVLATPAMKGFNIARAVARIPLADRVNRIFIASHLQTDAVQNYFTAELRTVAQPTLNIKQIAETKVFSPPLALQEVFATRIQAVESLKATHRAALAESNALFASLQHRAFAGQLSAGQRPAAFATIAPCAPPTP